MRAFRTNTQASRAHEPPSAALSKGADGACQIESAIATRIPRFPKLFCFLSGRWIIFIWPLQMAQRMICAAVTGVAGNELERCF